MTEPRRMTTARSESRPPPSMEVWLAGVGGWFAGVDRAVALFSLPAAPARDGHVRAVPHDGDARWPLGR
jgi:hypothetical protein